ncbi:MULTISPECIES: hypothetical protein [Actinokineospora]|uniref:Uncharacterized protein n=1 Tax=Actinokineospora fastidiosa TaxID=1816 RepID=A0A918LE01_9PSEU|nr:MULTISPECIES: hypothetical protein [Actinokineospora]UVS80216.1 hypothetical protein Actkin_03966 [Actinokineospora sp. UTMC 2448]GGS33779.1 hypothetical protein GCM10010171_30090 [Actinokineospora fastidiosa]
MTAELVDHRPALPRPPVLDGAHLGALQMVARGEVGGYGVNAVLRHRTDDLSALMVGALFTLRRDGFIALGSIVDPHDGWVTAELTSAGNRLMEIWLRRGRRTPDEVARHRDWFVLLRCAHRGELGLTEKNQITGRGLPPDTDLTARARELVSAGHLVVGSLKLRDCRLVTLSETGRQLHNRLDLSEPRG